MPHGARTHPADVVKLLASVLEVLAHIGRHLLPQALHGQSKDILHHGLAATAPGTRLQEFHRCGRMASCRVFDQHRLVLSGG